MMSINAAGEQLPCDGSEGGSIPLMGTTSHMGVSSNGRTTVSNSVNRGSIPLTFAARLSLGGRANCCGGVRFPNLMVSHAPALGGFESRGLASTSLEGPKQPVPTKPQNAKIGPYPSMMSEV